MNFIYRRQEYGFTLFESVCVIFLFSLLAIVLFQSLTVVCLPIRYSQKKSQLRYEARYLRQFIIHEFSLLYFSPSGDLNAVNSCIVKNITIDKSGAEIKFNYMSPRFAQVKSQLETNTIVVYGIHPWFQRDAQYLLEDGSQCEMAYLQSSRKSQAKYQQTVVFNSPIKLSEKKLFILQHLNMIVCTLIMAICIFSQCWENQSRWLIMF